MSQAQDRRWLALVLLAVLASIGNSRRDTVLETGSALPNAMTEGFQLALTVGAGMAVLGALTAYFLVSPSVPVEPDGNAVPALT